MNGQSFLLKAGVNKQTGELVRGNAQSHAIRFIEALPHEFPWRVQIHPFKPKGTEQQNRYFHMIVSEVAAVEDVSPAYKKEWFKAMYGPIIGEVNNKTLLKSWSDYTKQERMDMISHIQVYAAEHQIEVTQIEEPMW